MLHEAALVLGDKALLDKVEPLVAADGSMMYETFLDKRLTDADRH